MSMTPEREAKIREYIAVVMFDSEAPWYTDGYIYDLLAEVDALRAEMQTLRQWLQVKVELGDITLKYGIEFPPGSIAETAQEG